MINHFLLIIILLYFYYKSLFIIYNCYWGQFIRQLKIIKYLFKYLYMFDIQTLLKLYFLLNN